MRVTKVEVNLAQPRDAKARILAFVAIEFDSPLGRFVLRELKVIRGDDGPFVAMPCRKLLQPCPQCHNKNEILALYCNGCGGRLPDRPQGRIRIHADIFHPVDGRSREALEDLVMRRYWETVDAARAG